MALFNNFSTMEDEEVLKGLPQGIVELIERLVEKKVEERMTAIKGDY